MQENSEKVIAKMSIKAIGCNPKEASAKTEGDKTPVKLCIIGGIASGTKTWEDAQGKVVTALEGEFGGVNLQQSTPDFQTKFVATKLFLPGGIWEIVFDAVVGPKRDEQNTVEFAFEIYTVRANNAIGYSYQAIPKIQHRHVDKLANIWGLAPQIAAPTTPKPAELPAPTPAAAESAKSAKKGA